VIRTAVVSTLLGAALAVSPAHGQSSWQQVVNNELATLSSRARQQGFTSMVGQTLTGALNPRAMEDRSVTLVGGGNYIVFAACDQDCTDVDLRVFGPDGQLLGEDIQTDDRPVVLFTAAASGTYRITVMMAACSQAPCYWGAQVMTR